MSSGPVCLVVLDGWGLAEPGPGNAVDLAAYPGVRRAVARLAAHDACRPRGGRSACPTARWATPRSATPTSARAGWCARIWCGSTTTSKRAASAQNPVFQAAFEHARGSALHLIGLLSDGGVHSHIRHLQALIAAARAAGVEHVYVHAFTDGRDVSPTSGAGFAAEVPEIVTVSAAATGRWIATAAGIAPSARTTRSCTASAIAPTTAVEAIEAAYAEGVTDEFVAPTVIGDPAAGRIRAEDAVIFFNFRPDRTRQLTRALIEPGFAEFDRGGDPPLPFFVADDRVLGGVRGADRLPVRVARRGARRRPGRRRRGPAARRGDREVSRMSPTSSTVAASTAGRGRSGGSSAPRETSRRTISSPR